MTKLHTLVERTTFIFNNELLSDVKFVFSVSTEQRESKKVIPAHKFVLAVTVSWDVTERRYDRINKESRKKTPEEVTLLCEVWSLHSIRLIQRWHFFIRHKEAN